VLAAFRNSMAAAGLNRRADNVLNAPTQPIDIGQSFLAGRIGKIDQLSVRNGGVKLMVRYNRTMSKLAGGPSLPECPNRVGYPERERPDIDEGERGQARRRRCLNDVDYWVAGNRFGSRP